MPLNHTELKSIKSAMDILAEQHETLKTSHPEAFGHLSKFLKDLSGKFDEMSIDACDDVPDPTPTVAAVKTDTNSRRILAPPDSMTKTASSNTYTLIAQRLKRFNGAMGSGIIDYLETMTSIAERHELRIDEIFAIMKSNFVGHARSNLENLIDTGIPLQRIYDILVSSYYRRPSFTEAQRNLENARNRTTGGIIKIVTNLYIATCETRRASDNPEILFSNIVGEIENYLRSKLPLIYTNLKTQLLLKHHSSKEEEYANWLEILRLNECGIDPVLSQLNPKKPPYQATSDPQPMENHDSTHHDNHYQRHTHFRPKHHNHQTYQPRRQYQRPQDNIEAVSAVNRSDQTNDNTEYANVITNFPSNLCYRCGNLSPNVVCPPNKTIETISAIRVPDHRSTNCFIYPRMGSRDPCQSCRKSRNLDLYHRDCLVDTPQGTRVHHFHSFGSKHNNENRRVQFQNSALIPSEQDFSKRKFDMATEKALGNIEKFPEKISMIYETSDAYSVCLVKPDNELLTRQPDGRYAGSFEAQGLSFNVMIDSGSGNSLIALRDLNRLPDKNKIRITGEGRKLRSFTNTPINILKQVTFPINIFGQEADATFQVVKEDCENVLGSKFLTKYKYIMDFGSGRLFTPERVSAISNSQFMVMAKQNLDLNPGMSGFVDLKMNIIPSQDIDGYAVYELSNVTKFTMKFTTRVEIKDPNIFQLEIENTGETVLSIQSGLFIFLATPVDKISSIDDNESSNLAPRDTILSIASKQLHGLNTSLFQCPCALDQNDVIIAECDSKGFNGSIFLQPPPRLHLSEDQLFRCERTTNASVIFVQSRTRKDFIFNLSNITIPGKRYLCLLEGRNATHLKNANLQDVIVKFSGNPLCPRHSLNTNLNPTTIIFTDTSTVSPAFHGSIPLDLPTMIKGVIRNANVTQHFDVNDQSTMVLRIHLEPNMDDLNVFDEVVNSCVSGFNHSLQLISISNITRHSKFPSTMHVIDEIAKFHGVHTNLIIERHGGNHKINSKIPNCKCYECQADLCQDQIQSWGKVSCISSDIENEKDDSVHDDTCPNNPDSIPLDDYLDAQYEPGVDVSEMMDKSPLNWRDYNDLDGTAPEIKDAVSELLDKMSDVLTIDPFNSGKIPADIINVKFDMIHKPKIVKQPPVSSDSIGPLNDILEELEKRGIIKSCTSEFNLPIFLTFKNSAEKIKDRENKLLRSKNLPPIHKIKRRLIYNSQALNDAVTDIHCHLPSQKEVIDTIANKKFVTTIDFTSAYYSIQLHEDFQHYTAFTGPSGRQFKWTRLPMGFVNSGAYLNFVVCRITEETKRLVRKFYQNELTDDELNELLSYVDDLFSGHPELRDAYIYLYCLLLTIRKFNMKINVKKMRLIQFNYKLEILGVHVTEHHITPIASRCTIICQMERPKSIRELRKFIGMTNWFSTFLGFRSKGGYASVIDPLYSPFDGTTKPKTLKWTPEMDAAFLALKACLLDFINKSHLNRYAPLFISSDASDNAISATCFQVIDNKMNIIDLASKRLPLSLRKTSATVHLEILALRFALKKFNYLIINSPKIIIVGDSRILAYVFANKSASSGPLARLAAEIEILNPLVCLTSSFIHQRTNSTAMFLADFLSRQNSETKVKENLIKAANIDFSKLPIINFPDCETFTSKDFANVLDQENYSAHFNKSKITHLLEEFDHRTSDQPKNATKNVQPAIETTSSITDE